MNDAPRRLVLMRHAQAETIAPSDHERPLTHRGVAAAGEAGEWLRRQGITPDHALVSAALRTRETWDAAARSAQWTIEPDLEPALYAAGAESVMDLLHLVPEDARCVVVLGHNPTVSYVSQLLADGQGDVTALGEMAQGFPPGASAVFEVTESWSSLSFGDGCLVGFHVGQH